MNDKTPRVSDADAESTADTLVGPPVASATSRAYREPDPRRPLLLDLFCKQGGAAMGYWRAGFAVVGVDREPQSRYPFPFIQADALEILGELAVGVLRHIAGRPVAAIHASPPCQRYTTGGRVRNRGQHPDLIGDVGRMLSATDLPWVIENVPEAPLRADAILCGSMFDLKVRRHRLFECSFPVGLTPPCNHSGPIVGVYGHPHGQRGAWPGMLPSTLESWSDAMGIDWMDADGLSQAIPPAYTQWIGARLLASIGDCEHCVGDR